MSELKPTPRDDIIIGLHDPDDAAVVKVATGKVIVHTVDYFRLIDDPYLFGKIAANHSLMIFLLWGEAQSALAIATVPYGIESQPKRPESNDGWGHGNVE